MSKPKRYYVLPKMETELVIQMNGSSFFGGSVAMSWHEGQKGALAVFTNKRVAQRVAKKLGIDTALIVMEGVK